MISRYTTNRTPPTGHTIQVNSQRIVVKLQIRYTAVALSHLDTDCRVTPSFSASSSWDHLFFFLFSTILSARILSSVI